MSDTNQGYEPAYHTTYHAYLKDKNLDLEQACIMSYIACLQLHDKPVFISNEKLAVLFKMSIDALKRKLCKLAELGYIDRIRDYKNHRRYMVPKVMPFSKKPIIQIEDEEDSMEKSDPVDKNAEGGGMVAKQHHSMVAKQHHSMVAKQHHIYNKEYNKEDTKDLLSESSIRTTKTTDNGVSEPSKKKQVEQETEQAFGRVYEAHPRKEKRQAALKAFKTAFKRWLPKNPGKDLSDFESLLVGDLRLRAANNWFGREKSYIPLLSTYLNGAEWEGVIVTRAIKKEKVELDFFSTDWMSTSNDVPRPSGNVYDA